MSCTIASVRIPAGDQPVCDVRLDPYILIKDETTNTVCPNSIPDETDDVPYGEPEPNLVIRSRWYRYTSHFFSHFCDVTFQTRSVDGGLRL